MAIGSRPKLGVDTRNYRAGFSKLQIVQRRLIKCKHLCFVYVRNKLAEKGYFAQKQSMKKWARSYLLCGWIKAIGIFSNVVDHFVIFNKAEDLITVSCIRNSQFTPEKSEFFQNLWWHHLYGKLGEIFQSYKRTLLDKSAFFKRFGKIHFFK